MLGMRPASRCDRAAPPAWACSGTPPPSTTTSPWSRTCASRCAPPAASVADVDAVLDRLELGGRVRRTTVGRLSAGQRRRVALAVLVARRPELWLLDEPHAGLDAERQGRARERSSPRSSPRAPPCCWRRTSPTASGRWPTGSCPWSGGRGVTGAGATAWPRARTRRPTVRSRGCPCGVTPCWWRARTSASSCVRRVVMHQVVPVSRSWCSSCSRFALGPRPRPDGARRTRSVLGGRALRQRARRAAELRHRSVRRRPRRLAALRARSRRRVPGQGGRGRVQMVVLEVVSPPAWWCCTARTSASARRSWSPGLAGTAGLAAAGAVYGALAAGLRVRETLLPFSVPARGGPGPVGRDPGVAGRLGVRRRGSGDPVGSPPARLRRRLSRPRRRHLRDRCQEAS